jgi:hypothetical protein
MPAIISPCESEPAGADWSRMLGAGADGVLAKPLQRSPDAVLALAVAGATAA